jgi:hypothetical protein
MKPPEKQSDWELLENATRMQSLMDARNERLKDKKKRHENIDFTNIDFLYMQATVDNEIFNRKKVP